MRQSKRVGFLTLLFTLPWLSAPAQGQAPDYPAKPVKLIVPYTPGLVDSFARVMSQHLTEKLGQPMVVDNRPGANQAIGIEAAAKSAPDGYTLLIGTQSGLVLNTIARKSVPYDPVRDFAPVSLLFATPLYLFVTNSVPATSVQQLVALAKSRPGKLNFGSLGRGSSQHLAAEMFKSAAGIDIVHVPYQGSDRAALGLISGQVELMFDGGASVLPQVRAGKLKALASTGEKRTQSMPDLPTMGESMPGFVIAPWIGLVAPAGVPRPIIDKLNREVAAMLRLPATREKFAALAALELTPSTPEELGERIRADFPVWTKVMRDAGIDPE
jgi:tripartite-type tricarboxylate transporter receptor subunit TctC